MCYENSNDFFSQSTHRKNLSYCKSWNILENNQYMFIKVICKMHTLLRNLYLKCFVQIKCLSTIKGTVYLKIHKKYIKKNIKWKPV